MKLKKTTFVLMTVMLTFGIKLNSMAACNLANAGKTCTFGRKYIRGEIQHAQVTGAYARISTQYGTLCGAQVNSTAVAAQAAWVGVQNNGKWAQIGWAYRRDSKGEKKFVYIECNGDKYVLEKFLPAPSNGSTQRYYVYQETSGIWYYHYSGSLLGECSDTFWIKNTGTGNVAQYCGEIRNEEDDMPGTKAKPCSFRNLGYRINYGKLTSVTLQYLTSSDSTKWDFVKISSGFDMWDVCPGGDGNGN